MTYAVAQPTVDVPLAPGQRPLVVRANFFHVAPAAIPPQLYVYSVTFPLMNGRELTNNRVKKDLLVLALAQPFFQAYSQNWATEWNGLLVSLVALPASSFNAQRVKSVTVQWTNQARPNTSTSVTIDLQLAHVLNRGDLGSYLAGNAVAFNPSPWLRALNILARKRATDPSLTAPGPSRLAERSFSHQLKLYQAGIVASNHGMAMLAP
jgi:hypothetical protein